MMITLILHIFSGTAALLTGAGGLAFRKGARAHRMSGSLFAIFMLGMCISGGYLAYLVSAKLSLIAAVFTGYLVVTAWMTVRRGEGEAGRFEWAALITALVIAAGFFWFGVQAARGEIVELAAGAPIPTGNYYIFGAVALLAAFGDFRIVFRGGIAGAQRIARHLWRMCTALFIAAASVFLGQPQVFPAFMRETPVLLSVPVLAIIMLMLFWLARVLLTGWYRKRTITHGPTVAPEQN